MRRATLLRISEKVFGKCGTLWKESVKSRATVFILCLRLEGRCSIIAISQILQFGGESLPHTLVDEQRGVRLLIMASDEMILSPASHSHYRRSGELSDFED